MCVCVCVCVCVCNCEADQRICFRYTDSKISLLFKLLARDCDCKYRFVSDLVGNPEDLASRLKCNARRILYIFKHVFCSVV